MALKFNIDDTERQWAESVMSHDMSRLEILTRRRIKFIGFTRSDDYDYPIARIVVDGEEDNIWYDLSDEGTYWCEEMDVSGSVIELAWGMTR